MDAPAYHSSPCPFEKNSRRQLVRDDAFFMSLAYNQAIDAWRQDEGAHRFALIALGGEAIRRGAQHPSKARTIHGATPRCSRLRRRPPASANWRLAGATVYVTKEPCPMCSGAMLMSRVQRVCYAVPDPKMGLPRRSDQPQRPAARQPPPRTHRRGVLEAECRGIAPGVSSGPSGWSRTNSSRRSGSAPGNPVL